MIHEAENREDLELHLKQNGKKFNAQCVRLMEEMYKGRRLTSAIIFDEWRYDSRRLRDCRQHRPDIVKSRWEVDKDGKTKYMLYWIDVPLPPTKTKAIAEGQKILDMMNKNNFTQQQLF